MINDTLGKPSADLPKLSQFLNRFYLLVVINFFVLVGLQSLSLFNLYIGLEADRITPVISAVTPSAANSVELLDKESARKTVQSLLDIGVFRRVVIIDDFGRTLSEGTHEVESGQLTERVATLLGIPTRYVIDTPLKTPSTQTGLLSVEVNFAPLLAAELWRVLIIVSVATLVATLLAYFLVVRANRRISMGVMALVEATESSAAPAWEEPSSLGKLQFSELETVATRTHSAIKHLKKTLTVVSDYEVKQADLLEFIDAALTAAGLYSFIFSHSGDLLYSNTDVAEEQWIRSLAHLNLESDADLTRALEEMQGITTKNLGKTQKEEDIVDQPNVQLQVDHNDQSWLVVWSNLERGGVFVFVQEITVAQENARRSSHVEKMEALGRISSGVAHEFNNMLGIIVANLDMAGQEGIDADEARIFVTSATRAADRAASIVGQLKRMSKASDQAKDLVNLSQWAHIIRPMLSAAIGPQVDLNIECQEDLFITVDETFLDTAIVNLCKNASEAMGNHGRIDIRISPAREVSLSQHPYLPNAEYCEISVSDKGPGIPEGISRKIFEPFFTGKPLTTGTGLGLSSVYSFVTAANGAVHLEDVRTGGAKFVLLFRKSSPPVPNAVTKGLAAPPLISLDGSRILLVEDELELASSYRHALENRGATVIVKSSIIEANEFLENDPNISLAIVDKTLPDGSGLDLASKIRFDIPKCKVILMSGNLTGHEEELVDVNMVLDKPFRLSVLASACAKLSSS